MHPRKQCTSPCRACFLHISLSPNLYISLSHSHARTLNLLGNQSHLSLPNCHFLFGIQVVRKLIIDHPPLKTIGQTKRINIHVVSSRNIGTFPALDLIFCTFKQSGIHLTMVMLPSFNFKKKKTTYTAMVTVKIASLCNMYNVIFNHL